VAGRSTESLASIHMRSKWPVLAAIVFVVVAANAIAMFNFVGPYLVTHAPDRPPAEVTCDRCSEPSVQKALGQARRIGRENAMESTGPNSLLWWALPFINIAAPILAWVLARRKNAG
jgi:hypothetical protein